MNRPAGTTDDASPLPYILPMGAFLALTALESYLPRPSATVISPWYPLAYTVKVAIVAAVACLYRSTWRDLRPVPSAATLAVSSVLGLAITGVWVALDGWYPALPFQGHREAFDPSTLSAVGRWAFIAVRLVGLAVLVPLIEELFWRSFLMRWVIDSRFEHIPIGQVTPAAAAVTSVCFALEHPEWLPGLITGLAWAELLRRTRSVSACLVSHAVANLALGLHVIISQNWKFW